ncbi:probable tRNA (uracil-O(2)-)-methyltransferase isoform X2 [Hypanus sabinus]|uniref:probable tRNA (uracil-O(2)-)-methyltransferase isoform X2 n=1 Tax=Hypanus sabinus TaxID=79690 RepID=UPI0028C4E89F|nr:probable tRNA (uracil-O(2)-)-methyltransferase isoform X2 [Hypanus sabinus]
MERRLSLGSAVTSAGFWTAVGVWTLRPQVANRRLSGCRLEAEREVSCSCGGAVAGLGPVVAELLPGLSAGAAPELDELVPRGVERVKVLLRTVIPKGGVATGSEIVLQDFLNNTATFIPVNGQIAKSCTFRKNNIYRFKLQQVKGDESSWSVSISILYPEEWDADGILYPKTTWLTDVLLTKIVKWSTESKKSYFKNTLSLISVEKYSEYYHNLKAKYKEIVKIWPEVTNPEKYVYEDVAIAAYLLILWEDERAAKGLTDKQSFIDLGCGNGLLVHILTNEGHPGKGIDVRKRKIWDKYGPQTHLEERTFTPSDDFLFPDVDWLIGNHSDELTPWIPVIAARSSYSCRYFVLPCCFYDFYGKYCRRETINTQYRAYLNFITEVGSICGFKVEEDCLRIPSTKRVCLIGNQRTYLEFNEERLDKERTLYIKERYSSTLRAGDHFSEAIPLFTHDVSHCSNVEHPVLLDTKAEEDSFASSKWLAGFQPREKAQKIRNCASLPRDFINCVVLQVAKALLKTNQDPCVNSGVEDSTGYWNKGVIHGQVRIRDWTKEKQTRKQISGTRKMSSDTFKTRLCWFFVNHPDGCPRSTENCPFAHGAEELRPQAAARK